MVWDAQTGAEVVAMTHSDSGTDFEKTVRSVSLSADGKRVASGGNDARVIVWDLTSGEKAPAAPAAVVAQVVLAAPAPRVDANLRVTFRVAVPEGALQGQLVRFRVLRTDMDAAVAAAAEAATLAAAAASAAALAGAASAPAAGAPPTPTAGAFGAAAFAAATKAAAAGGFGAPAAGAFGAPAGETSGKILKARKPKRRTKK